MGTIMTQERTEAASRAFPAPDNNFEATFRALTELWREETGPLSSPTRKAAHPAYQQIIEMGERVIPFILQDMQNHPAHWSMALQAITGENPVPKVAAGHVAEVANAWTEWGRDKGFVA